MSCNDIDILQKIQRAYTLGFRKNIFTMVPWGGVDVGNGNCDIKYDVYDIHGNYQGVDYRRINLNDMSFSKSHKGVEAQDIKREYDIFNPIVELANSNIMGKLPLDNSFMKPSYILHIFITSANIYPYASAQFSVMMSFMEGKIRKAYVKTYEAIFLHKGKWSLIDIKETPLVNKISAYKKINDNIINKTYCYYDASQDIKKISIEKAVFIGANE